MTSLSKQELQLIDGGKDIRDKYISKTEVLDRVKELTLLPNNESITINQLADYYEVSIEVVKKVYQRNKDELISDGVYVLEGNEYKKFVGDIVSLSKYRLSNKSRKTTIFPRRAILRVGMLLRDSEVAKEVRTYLLNVEESATPIQKKEARKSNWTNEDDMVILNSVLTSVNNNGTLTDGLTKASQLLNKSYSTVSGRWQYKVKNFANKDILEKIRNNRGKHLKDKDTVDNIGNNLNLEIGYQIDKVYRENVQLEKENALLKEENTKLKRIYKKVKSEHSKVMNIIGSAMKHHTNQILKMDGNKGL